MPRLSPASGDPRQASGRGFVSLALPRRRRRRPLAASGAEFAAWAPATSAAPLLARRSPRAAMMPALGLGARARGTRCTHSGLYTTRQSPRSFAISDPYVGARLLSSKSTTSSSSSSSSPSDEDNRNDRDISTSTANSEAPRGNNDNDDNAYDLKKTVAILTGSQFINNLGFGCVIPVLPLFASDMGLGASGVGLILSTSAVARLCLNIPLGRLSDRIGRKPLMVGGQIGTAIASIGTGVCSTLPQLLACRLLLGAGSSAALSGSGAYMADITTRAPDQRAKIIGFQSTVINIAYAVGPAVGGYLCDLYGARLMFFIVGGAALITSAGFSSLPETYRGLESTKSNSGNGRENADEAAVVVPRQQASAWQVYRPLLLNPDQQGLMGMNFAVFGSYSALMTVFPLFAASVLGADGSVAEVGALFASGAVVGFVVSISLSCVLILYFLCLLRN